MPCPSVAITIEEYFIGAQATIDFHHLGYMGLWLLKLPAVVFGHVCYVFFVCACMIALSLQLCWSNCLSACSSLSTCYLTVNYIGKMTTTQKLSFISYH
jgi:hypothetical protein